MGHIRVAYVGYERFDERFLIGNFFLNNLLTCIYGK